MEDTTQELAESLAGRYAPNPHLSTPLSSAKAPFNDGMLDLSTLEDPLDDTTEPKMSRFPHVALPPTPKDSPLKANMARLRGSPIKTPRRQFRTPALARNAHGNDYDDQEASPISLDDFDDDFDPRSLFDQGVRDTKSHSGYRTLLSSTTDKLTAELHHERVLVKELQREIGALKREKNDANRLKTDLESLEKSHHNLRSRNLALEIQVNNLQRNDKSEHLARENKLLREKLLKYKKLYESTKGSDSRSRDLRMPNMEVAGSPTPRAASAGDIHNSRTVPAVQERAKAEMWDEAGFVHQIRRILAALEAHVSGEKSTQKNDQNDTHDNGEAYGEDYVSAKTTGIESPPKINERIPRHVSGNASEAEASKEKAAPETSPAWPEPQKTGAYGHGDYEQRVPLTQPDCKEQFARLEQVLQLLREDFRKSAASTHGANSNRSNGPETASTNLDPSPQVVPNAVEDANAIPNVAPNVIPNGTPNAVPSASNAQHDVPHIVLPDSHSVPFCQCVRPNTPVAKCTACSSVASRPQSESTPEDNTQALMGKFLWNRTV